MSQRGQDMINMDKYLHDQRQAEEAGGFVGRPGGHQGNPCPTNISPSLQYLPDTVQLGGETFYPGWVDVQSYPALAPYCVELRSSPDALHRHALPCPYKHTRSTR